MSTRRISSTQRGTRATRSRALKALTSKSLKAHRFIGISLSGGKTDKTCLALIEFYPQHNKIFLSRLFEKIKTDELANADTHLHHLLLQCPGPIEALALDVPLQLPKCMRCELKCPGYDVCTEPEIEWMWKFYKQRNLKKRPQKLFTPYTERCVELIIANELEEPFHMSHALGSNSAPLTARAHYVTRRLKLKLLEVLPKLSLWRIGTALQLPKSQLRLHKHWSGGIESRRFVLNRLIERNIAFVYEQDAKTLVDNVHAFDAFLCALTAYLHFKDQCEDRPRELPQGEHWLAFPKKNFTW